MKTALVLLVPLLALPVLAQPRISQVLIYPGGAEVTRVQAVAAGAREAVFACIPARYDPESFQPRASEGLRTGELRVQTLSADAAPECSGDSALDAQIRTLEDQKAGLAAERSALDLVLGYLKGAGSAEARGGVQPAMAESIRRQGQEALKAQHTLARRIEAVDKELRPLLAQRQRERGGVTQWLRVSVAVQGAGELALSARTPHAGWSPSYRADLDASGTRVAFERRATLAQATGEAWRDVKLTLSTREPQRASRLPEPEPWWLRPAAPPPPPASRITVTEVMSPKQAPMAMVAQADVSAALPRVETEFDLQFSVPGAISLASGTERPQVTLERLQWTAQSVTLVQPQVQAQAYRVARVARPAGFFPGGPLQLLREGSFVGQDQFEPGEEAQLTLFFGPDDRVRVRVEPEQRLGDERGFIGARRIWQIERRFVLENTSRTPLALEVIEAAPHPQHQDIEVQARFEPAPNEGRWRELDGVRLWRWILAPAGSLRFSASYRVSAPKDMAVEGL